VRLISETFAVTRSAAIHRTFSNVNVVHDLERCLRFGTDRNSHIRTVRFVMAVGRYNLLYNKLISQSFAHATVKSELPVLQDVAQSPCDATGYQRTCAVSRDYTHGQLHFMRR